MDQSLGLPLPIKCLSGQHLVPAVDFSWVSVRNLGCIVPGTTSRSKKLMGVRQVETSCSSESCRGDCWCNEQGDVSGRFMWEQALMQLLKPSPSTALLACKCLGAALNTAWNYVPFFPALQGREDCAHRSLCSGGTRLFSL